jgi:DNA gyrase subunit A
MEELNKEIVPFSIKDEMENSYLAYAMSVIVSRALPDARDGLKPVHRRILYAMMELDLSHRSSFKKSARIVGEVMGKYHPHGDSAIYDTMVRMAQSWSMRYELVDGQGNFGSIDGDRAAAYRYTEARMKSMAEELLADIGKETVDFQDNFDGGLQEPVVLPSRFPNLLVNGSDGIAVGMATKIPPHNLTEVIDGILMYMDNPKASVEELMTVIKGPDFPTGGYIVGRKGIVDAYKSGRGRVVMRAKTDTEEVSRDKMAIIVTEIPFQVNKSALIEHIADLVKDKKIESISDIRDESDRKGMRIVIELKRGEAPELTLNQLYKHTNLQSSFGVNMVALVNNRPETLGLQRLLGVYVSHRFDVITRRTRYELRKAEERAHILRGLKIALDNIDEVIQIIKSSETTDTARERLIGRFDFSEIQARAILSMRLQSLTNMETQKILDELEELEKMIAHYKEILANRYMVYDIIKEELQEIRDKYGDERRSEIIADTGEIDVRDLLKDEQKLVTVSHTGYLKSVPLETYSAQRRGGKGMSGMSLKDDDFIQYMFIATTFDYVMFFTNRGRCWSKYSYTLPEGSRTSRGKAMVNFLNLDPGEKVTAMLPVKTTEDGNYENGEELFITMVTKQGKIKKSKLNDYISATRENGIRAIKFADESDEVVAVKLSNNSSQVVIGTRFGKAIRFPEETVRPMGRVSQGVKGIDFKEKGDEVVGMEALSDEQTTLLVITNEGYGKRTALEEYRITNRGGYGIRNIRLSTRQREVIGFTEIRETDELILISRSGKIIRMAADTIPVYGRDTQGVRLINLDEEDHLVGFSVIEAEDLSDEDGEGTVPETNEDTTTEES